MGIFVIALAVYQSSSSASASSLKMQEKTSNLFTLDQNSLLPYSIPSSSPDLTLIEDKKPDTYIVRRGDTLSGISRHFGISLATLLWANKLTSRSYIRPGQKLEILPVSGIQHTVKKGETVSIIAKRYKSDIDKIIEFNNLPADGFISIGQKLIIPGGQMPVPKRRKAPKTYVRAYITGPGTHRSHHFPYGQCTWYVAQKRYVPWSGNAKSWLFNARARGFSVCIGSNCMPQAGAIVSLTGRGWLTRRYGHVAYVEKVAKRRFLISEMNHIGWAKTDRRWISIGSSSIRGFIY